MFFFGLQFLKRQIIYLPNSLQKKINGKISSGELPKNHLFQKVRRKSLFNCPNNNQQRIKGTYTDINS